MGTANPIYLFYILMFLIILLLSLLIAYVIIYAKYQSGVYIPTLATTSPFLFENYNFSTLAGNHGHVLSHATTIGNGANAGENPLVLHENSRTRKIEGGFIIKCACNTDQTVKFTVTDRADGGKIIGSETHKFKSTHSDVFERVVVKFTAPKSSTIHIINVNTDTTVHLLEAHYYYY